uniref:Uncharacterized protein n=1 Tax=Cacopsylla melanoneura TaxID=428564 RepID=A0A8D8XSN7_9HEMI
MNINTEPLSGECLVYPRKDKVPTLLTTWSVVWRLHLTIKYLMIFIQSVSMRMLSSQCQQHKYLTRQYDRYQSAILIVMYHQRNMCAIWRGMNTGWGSSIPRVKDQVTT